MCMYTREIYSFSFEKNQKEMKSNWLVVFPRFTMKFLFQQFDAPRAVATINA